ncbi:hypothetical protein N7478_007676 [Penicillium angulare]|uniref:uncharacterized protein n=1 Tax=Penicillium angulare TaxID=116970 RepID=UPI002541B64A|nr:uncharacterized protein N7478_007676 [Penicillium angulare]KAJ5272551.1 hypothetical protein N7478_007676 [Penicillium angulare]
MEPQITPNTFCTYTGTKNDFDTTIFFISGNPGLIGYYHPFLSLLAQDLAGDDSQNETTSFQIYGCSLGGFQIPPPDEDQDKSSKTKTKNHLYSLEDQIRFVHGNLVALMRGNSDITSATSRTDKATATATSNSTDVAAPTKRPKVILIGHSVGAYIAMEILRRHREGIPMPGSSRPEPDLDFDLSATFDIIGGVMLFPTVKDIAHSPSGQKLTTLLSILPHFAIIVGFLARILTFLLPSTTLKSTIRFVMKNPPTHALDTTFEFLKSGGGVRQALHMAADEMRTITSDKWTDDVWGVAHTQEPLTRLFFYFGRNDHWVAERTRDEIIALRSPGRNGHGDHHGWSGPKMSVCEEGLPHAFCLKHNDIMARKVGNMIRDIVL